MWTLKETAGLGAQQNSFDKERGIAMKEFIITTDSCADLPAEYAQRENIIIQPLYYSIDDVVYGNEQTLEPEEFYGLMRNGKMPNTMAVNPELMVESLREPLKEGKDILHIAFSSALSSSYQNAVIAANDLMEEFPEQKILVIDSLAASLGQGMMVYKAAGMKTAGKSLEETAEWIMENRLHFCHQFTVEDLNHLQRGGRLSKTTAVIGTIVNLKPMLYVNEEGKLSSLGVVRGKKKAMARMVDHMAKAIVGYEDQNEEIFITHGDSFEEALYLEKLVKERLGIESKMINFLCPTLGAHAGPGTVALFYIGNKR